MVLNSIVFCDFCSILDGFLSVTKDSEILGSIEPGYVFGELAVLYNCTRTASVHAESDVIMWCLDRRVFQAIMMKTGLERRNENLAFLQRSAALSLYFQCTLDCLFMLFVVCHFSVPLLKSLSDEKLSKLADVLEVVSEQKDRKPSVKNHSS